MNFVSRNWCKSGSLHVIAKHQIRVEYQAAQRYCTAQYFSLIWYLAMAYRDSDLCQFLLIAMLKFILSAIN